MDRILPENGSKQHRSSKPEFTARKADKISPSELRAENAWDIQVIRPGQQRM